MKSFTTSPIGSFTASVASRLVALIIVLIPLHAFLTVYAASFLGHYTLLRLWKELLVVLIVGLAGLQIMKAGRWQQLRRQRDRLTALSLAIGLYFGLLIATAAVAVGLHTVNLKAATYGLLLDSRFLVFFAVCWWFSRQSDWLSHHWRQLLLIPAGLVLLLGLLQATLLPANFLTHFGYNHSTIAALQTVDQKVGYQRIQSTLRGANPLGAYLILIIAASAVLLLSAPTKRWPYSGLLIAALSVLGLTYSRSAWIGALVTLLWILQAAVRSPRLRRNLIIIAGIGLLVCVIVGYSLRTNDTFQNTFFHTDEHSRSTDSSNQGHLTASRRGLQDVLRRPFGSGPGTAGPASLYNLHPARIAENYYLQIGQEVGVIGIGLFVAINVLVGRQLLRQPSLLARILFASLLGISIVNLLSHAWTDDTLCYVWWGLAGIALAVPAVKNPETLQESPGAAIQA